MINRNAADRSGTLADAEQWQAEIEITHAPGLHARPSVTFTRLARSFACSVEIEVSGEWLNGKSIVKIIGARIRKGSRLKIRATGPNGDAAVTALCQLIERDFDEDRAHDATG
nr:HPr family phosphocarrier protein [uncultured Gellertiella sp.]